MNSLFNRSSVLVAACCVMLAGCDSIKDVREAPFTDVPTQQSVLEGTVTGLGTVRPVALSYNGQPNCLAPDPANASVRIPSECRFYGTQGQDQTHFSFGSFDVGTAYDITVRTQPYGKLCSVTNGTGTVGSTTTRPVVACVNDPAADRYDLTVNIAPALQALDNLKVSLTTEEGVVSMDATGQTSVVFEDRLINTQTNLPLFQYRVTATTDTTAGGQTTSNFCTFTASANFTQGGENRTSSDVIVVPSGPATVTASTCAFPVTATVQYNGTPAQVMPSTGMTLALRNHLTGVDEQTLEVMAFTTGATTVAFPTLVSANSNALYELVVVRHPEGQHCVVYGTTTTFADTTSVTAGTAVSITAPTAGAVLLVDPTNSDWWAHTNRSVRCRAIPAAENQLTGTYQMDRVPGNQPQSATDTNPPRMFGRAREFLTFFDDGTFLYGINMNSASTGLNFLNNTVLVNSPNSTFPLTSSQVVRNNYAASSGVTHGFYAYNSTAGTITFTVVTATSIVPAGRGLNGMPGYAAGAVTATNVTKAAGPTSTLSMTFTSGANSRLWTMSEPDSIEGEISGTWVTADHRRAFAYNKGETYAFHMGVNGMGNLQDTCLLVVDGSTQSAGQITRHAGSATNSDFQYTCAPGILNLGSTFARTPDLPHYAVKNSTPSGLGIGPTTPRIAPGFNGRFPGTASQLDNRPGSPVNFEVTSGSPDTLTVQETLNGVPINQPVVFVRERAN